MPFNLEAYPNRSGEIIAAGINQGAATLADDIQQSARVLQEKKGYHTVLKALAQDPSNGIDPASIDRMSLGTAKGTIMAAEVRRQQAGARAQQQTAQAGAALPGQILSNLQPKANFSVNPVGGAPAPDVLGASLGVTQQPSTPGMNPLMAQLTALSQNPRAVFSPQGQEVFKNMLRTMNTPPKTPTFGTDPSGRSIAVDPSGRVQWAPNPPRTPAAAGPVEQRNKPPTIPKGGYMDHRRTKSGDTVQGAYDIYDKDGNVVDSWEDPQSTPRAAAAKASVFDMFGGGGDKGGGMVITDADGRQWHYKGTAADPKADTDEANWEPVEQ